jgi:predicted nucleic acid-binding protein
MTAFLLDTSALIDFSKHTEPTTSQILDWVDAGETLAICAISVAEFYTGLSSSDISIWQDFVTSLAYCPISFDAAMRAGQDRYRYARQGIAIATTDALLAAVAREQNAVLVTGNVKDFPMDDLMLFPLPG